MYHIGLSYLPYMPSGILALVRAFQCLSFPVQSSVLVFWRLLSSCLTYLAFLPSKRQVHLRNSLLILHILREIPGLNFNVKFVCAQFRIPIDFSIVKQKAFLV